VKPGPFVSSAVGDLGIRLDAPGLVPLAQARRRVRQAKVFERGKSHVIPNQASRPTDADYLWDSLLSLGDSGEFLDSRNHILLESEPAWGRFCEAVLDFMGLAAPGAGRDQAFDELSPRERAILALLAEGLANAEIAERLAISEKTVRNHVSNVFDKLGVWTRAQAIVFARDRGFRE
jgi:DNA-binding CsgD family transcriptional regulator